MSLIWKSMVRTAKQHFGSYLGAVVIIALGIFIYIAMIDTLFNLKNQVDRYYDDYHLADVFAQVEAIPEEELMRLSEIAGIDQVYGRLSKDVRILSADQTAIVTVHLLAYETGQTLNQIRLVPERKLQRNQIYLGSRMAESYGYIEGETIRLLINGEQIAFTLAGKCYEPEYIYAILPNGSMMPDGELYDIACIDKKYLEQLLGRAGVVNEIGFSLQQGYRYEDVRYQLMEHLQPYGITSLTDREKQSSYQMVEGEVNELISIGTVLPVVFLIISVFMLSIVLKKMIDKERSLIGTMKAFGYRDWELMVSYLCQGVIIGIAGAVLGSLAAVPFGRMMFSIYVGFFNLPDPFYRSYWVTRIAGGVIAVVFSTYAVYTGVKGILQINPSEAMRAAAPEVTKLMSIPQQLAARLNAMQKMGLRAIARSPFRTFVIVLAIAFPFGMSSMLFSFQGVAEQMFFDQFDKVETYDLQVSLDQYVTQISAQQAAAGLEGIAASEAVASFGVELRNENINSFALLYGLNPYSEHYKIMDINRTFYQPSASGLIINSRVAAELNVSAGDRIEVVNLWLAPEPVTVPVIEVIDESLGTGCYMDIGAMKDYFQTAAPVNRILITVKPGRMERVKEQLLYTTNVVSLVDTERILEGYQEMMVQMLIMMNIFSVMSVAAGMILIYNISMISIRERRIEFGTLLIMGTTDREMGQMVWFEQAVYFAVGILAGFPLSFGFKLLIEKLVMSDSYTINMVIKPQAYAVSGLICLGILLISSAAVIRMIKRIEPAEILKERE